MWEEEEEDDGVEVDGRGEDATANGRLGGGDRQVVMPFQLCHGARSCGRYIGDSTVAEGTEPGIAFGRIDRTLVGITLMVQGQIRKFGTSLFPYLQSTASNHNHRIYLLNTCSSSKDK